jgi:hypothetical protein
VLFQLVEKVCSRISGLDVKSEAPRFAAQPRKTRPSLPFELEAQGIAKGKIDQAILVLSTAEHGVIKGIPALAGEMANVLRTGSGVPAYRCVLAASLAYFVQPQDLLPDGLPGGYGFRDDALFLHEACAVSWELTGDNARAEEKRKIFQFIYIFVPDGSRQLFQQAIGGLAATLYIMRALDPMLAEMTTQTLIANPLQPITPPMGAPAAFPDWGLSSQLVRLEQPRSTPGGMAIRWESTSRAAVEWRRTGATFSSCEPEVVP